MKYLNLRSISTYQNKVTRSWYLKPPVAVALEVVAEYDYQSHVTCHTQIPVVKLHSPLT